MQPKRKCLLDYYRSNATSTKSFNQEIDLNIDNSDTVMHETLLVDPESLSNQDSSFLTEDITERSFSLDSLHRWSY